MRWDYTCQIRCQKLDIGEMQMASFSGATWTMMESRERRGEEKNSAKLFPDSETRVPLEYSVTPAVLNLFFNQGHPILFTKHRDSDECKKECKKTCKGCSSSQPECTRDPTLYRCLDTHYYRSDPKSYTSPILHKSPPPYDSESYPDELPVASSAP